MVSHDLAGKPRWATYAQIDKVLWVILCLVLNWFGDSLDGTLICGLGFTGIVNWRTVIAMLIPFLLLSCGL